MLYQHPAKCFTQNCPNIDQKFESLKYAHVIVDTFRTFMYIDAKYSIKYSNTESKKHHKESISKMLHTKLPKYRPEI